MTGEAEVKYLDGDFRVVRPGAFVRCAVTGVAIPLEELKYWSVDLQAAYVNPDAVLKRYFPNARRPTSAGGGRLSRCLRARANLSSCIYFFVSSSYQVRQ